jgi:hypothetical protein
MRILLWRSAATVSVVIMLAGLRLLDHAATTPPTSHSATPFPLRRVGTHPHAERWGGCGYSADAAGRVGLPTAKLPDGIAPQPSSWR